MKVVFLVKYYDLYQIELLKKIPNWKGLNYSSFINEINDDYFLMYNSFINHLRNNGVDAKLIIPNFLEVQTKWANENNTEISKNWNYDITQKQIETEKPDILFVNSNFEYWGDFLIQIKKHVKKICAWVSCPFPFNLSFKDIDLVYTLFPPHYEFFKQKKINAKIVSAGFDPDILKHTTSESQYETSFVGGIGSLHKKRTETLIKLSKKVNIDFWGYGFQSQNFLKNFYKNLKTSFAFSNNYNGLAWGLKMFSILQNSKITLNIHGDIAANYSVNMRLFEATGVGSLLLTEENQNINDFFVPDKEIITFSSVEDAIEKIEFYLKNNKERDRIAKAGQRKTLEKFNYSEMIKDYLFDFKSLLND